MEKRKISEIANKEFIEDNDKLLIFDETGQSLKLAQSDKFEKTSNKQNSLEPDGTGEKYTTVDAVNILKNNLHDIAFEFEDITGEVVQGKFVRSSDGRMVNAIGSPNSTAFEHVYIHGIDTIYYTGKAKGNTGVAFLKEDKTLLSMGYEINSNDVFRHPINVPSDAYYVSASSRDSDVIVKVETFNYSKLSDKVDKVEGSRLISQLEIDEISKIPLIEGNLISIESAIDLSYSKASIYNGVSSVTQLGVDYTLQSDGDYFEIDLDLKKTEGDTKNMLAVIGSNVDLRSYFGFDESRGWYIRDTAGDFCLFGAKALVKGKYKASIVGSNWQLEFNDVVLGTTQFKNSLTISNVGRGYHRNYFAKMDVYSLKIHTSTSDFESYDLYSLRGSTDVGVAYYQKNSENSQVEKPNVVVEFDKDNETFYISTRLNNTDYYGRYRVQRESSIGTPNHEILYKDIYRINICELHKLNNGEFQYQDKNLITAGESESVFKPEGGVPYVDHCGGVHGDEMLTSVDFYINGVKLSATDLAQSFRVECDEFTYIQKSTFHEVAKTKNVLTEIPTSSGGGIVSLKNGNWHIDNVDTGLIAYAQNTLASSVSTEVAVDDGGFWNLNNVIVVNELHPIWANHIKETIFTTGGYLTKNNIEWLEPIENYWWFGIVCIGNDAATVVRNENYEEVELVRGSSQVLKRRGLKDMYYSSNENSLSAFVSATFTSDKDIDNNAQVFVSDKTGYSKYYRSSPTATPSVNDVWKAECNVKFSVKL